MNARSLVRRWIWLALVPLGPASATIERLCPALVLETWPTARVLPAAGRLLVTAAGQQVMACPTWQGGKDWEAGAYSPLTNLMYMPLRHTCGRMMASAGIGWYD